MGAFINLIRISYMGLIFWCQKLQLKSFFFGGGVSEMVFWYLISRNRISDNKNFYINMISWYNHFLMSKFKFLMTLWYKELLCNIKNEILISGIFCWYQHWKGITEMLFNFLKKNSYSGNKKVVVFQLPNLVSLKFLCSPFFCA